MKSPKFATTFAAALLSAVLLSPAALAQTKMEVPWMGLAQALDGRVVNTVLLDGAVLRGRVLDVSYDELRFQVKKSSKPVLYPKGEVAVPKGQVKVFSYTYRNGTRGRKLGAVYGGAAGVFATIAVASIATNEGGRINGAARGVLAGIAGAGVGLGYGIGHAADTETMTVLVAQGIE